jgi:hypothetical protein
MPDRRKHRGPNQEDVRLFDVEALPVLYGAAADFCWLLDRGYPHDSTLKLVGDRYDLVARQRTAVSRCCCSHADAERRLAHLVTADQLSGAALWLDGYNVLTTIEAALAGGVILAGRDGAYRDMASMHGSYRKVDETLPALELLGRAIAAQNVAECRWLLDKPVSNSGRLKEIIERMAADRGWPWRVELVPNPDAVLIAGGDVGWGEVNRSSGGASVAAATADSAILDRCPAWFNLAKDTIVGHMPDAWIVDLTAGPSQMR